MTQRYFINNFKQQQGVMTTIFAMSLATIITLIALSLNTAVISHQKARLEHAIESAVIAIGLADSGQTTTTATQLTLNDYREIVTSVLSAFFPSSYHTIDFTLDPPIKTGDPYTISAEKQFDYILGGWLSWKNIASTSQFKLGSKIGVDVVQGNIEVALIMDNSGSMFADIDTLKDSAKLFINQLIDNRANSEQVYISIVPFSYSVNIGKQNLSWISDALAADAQQYGACTNYRYPNPPATEIIQNAVVPPLATQASSNSRKFPGYASGPFAPCTETPILGLSNDKDQLVAKVNQMVASGTTDGDHGIIWGWRTLSENWQGVWQENTERPLKKNEVKKVALFFSDGSAISNEREIFLPICEAMKDEGIEIYTVQFSTANDSMQACASNDAGNQYYFYANNQQQLKQAFSKISQSVGFELKLRKL